MTDAYNQKVIGKIRCLSNCGITYQGRLEEQIARAKEIDNALSADLWKHKVREYKSCVARQFVPTDKGELGFMKAETVMKDTILSNWEYICTKPELELVKTQAEVLGRQSKRSLYKDYLSIAKDKVDKPIKALRSDLKRDAKDNETKEWKLRTTSSSILNEEICLKDSFLWMRRGHLGKETVRIIMGCQEGHLFTNSKAKTSRKTSNMCRKCSQYRETEDHILTGCSFWRNLLMVSRHDNIVQYISHEIIKLCGMIFDKKTKVYENEEYHVSVDLPVRTQAQLMYNKPDIVWIEKMKKKIFVIEISVTGVKRLQIQEKRERQKYEVNGNHPEDDLTNCVRGNNLIMALKK
ncbi:unnamed protein product [Auanema sp. JU1783]|nr:unnamed protein product [Auanema sp. JU1783]